MDLARLRPMFFPLVVMTAWSLGLLGCEKQACFEWSAPEGACPSADDALEFFQNTTCVNAVRSVDSSAEFDGELCCYDVTSYDTGDEACGSPSSGNTAGGGFGGKPVPPPIPPMQSGGVGGSSAGSAGSGSAGGGAK